MQSQEEENYFMKKNAELNERLRRKRAADKNKAALAEATGIRDDTILEELHDLGITEETMAVLSLVPLISVAWADAEFDQREKAAVRARMDELGIDEGSAAHAMVASWFEAKPSEEVCSAWARYIGALCQNLHADAIARLRAEVVSRARQVAGASGGVLGLGKVSGAEARVLAELERAFK